MPRFRTGRDGDEEKPPTSTLSPAQVGLFHTIAGMNRTYWTKVLQEAERELQAATRLSEINAAARKLQRAKAELRQLDAERPKKPNRPSRARGGAGAAS